MNAAGVKVEGTGHVIATAQTVGAKKKPSSRPSAMVVPYQPSVFPKSLRNVILFDFFSSRVEDRLRLLDLRAYPRRVRQLRLNLLNNLTQRSQRQVNQLKL